MAQYEIRMDEIELDEGIVEEVVGGKSVLTALEELTDSDLLRELTNAIRAHNKARLLKIRRILQERGLQAKLDEILAKENEKLPMKPNVKPNAKENKNCY